jgi:hypothetical protein
MSKYFFLSALLFLIIFSFAPAALSEETCSSECETEYITCTGAALDETEAAACDDAYSACCAGFNCCSCYEDMTEEEMAASDDCAQCSSDGFDFNTCDISDEDLEAATTESSNDISDEDLEAATTESSNEDEGEWVISPDVPYKLETPLGTKIYVSNLSDYISTIYNFALSIVGILATVAIIFAGSNWAMAAGNESIITSAKETIFGALIGLIIVVGSYTILNFINPQLVSLKGAQIMKIPFYTGANTSICMWELAKPTGMVFVDDSLCDANQKPLPKTECIEEGCDTIAYSCFCISGKGIAESDTQVVQGIRVAKTIATNVDAMMTAAKVAGLNLTGSGYRTFEQQVAIRQAKCQCGSDTNCLYTKHPNQCNPPVAIPGTSMHEKGEAIDFECDGEEIKSHDNKCFEWLDDNAEEYGFENYSKEPWHWSTNGK